MFNRDKFKEDLQKIVGELPFEASSEITPEGIIIKTKWPTISKYVQFIITNLELEHASISAELMAASAAYYSIRKYIHV